MEYKHNYIYIQVIWTYGQGQDGGNINMLRKWNFRSICCVKMFSPYAYNLIFFVALKK